MNNSKAQKVFVGLSGGVDSAVTAALLKQQGYNVVGVYMKNWSGDDYGIQSECPWEEDQKDAEAVCEKLGIEFRSFNFEKDYRDKVVEYFFNEYERGRTPNPDVMCNKEIKFKLFFEKATQEFGADLIATGHYAIRKDGEDGNAHLYKGIDSNKDQTYFLYNLAQEQLRKTLFPIGHLEKPEVRKLAKEFGLPNAEKPDSQGICFIGEIDVLKFLMSRLPEKPGNIVDIDTEKKVGEHKGSYFHTIGQRKGLGIGGQEIPYFVVDKDFKQNIVYVGKGHDHPNLYKTEVKLENLHKIYDFENSGLSASVRYRNKAIEGTLDIESLTFKFDKPQWAAASGQSLVIYKGDECVGGGVIQ